MEIWQDLKDYEGLYQVSQSGKVKRVISNRCLKERILRHNIVKGYHRVTFSKDANKKQYSVHILVAKQFIPNPEDKPFINHKDSDKDNNHVSNLEWCTQHENVKHSFEYGFRTGIRCEANSNAKLTSQEALSIKFLCKDLGFEQKDVAKEYGISKQLVSSIVTNKAWVHA